MSIASWFAHAHKDLILDGTLLAIDPSSGSKDSMPGYALYKSGQLIDSGFLQLDAGKPLELRLWQLLGVLTKDFLLKEDIDVVVVENIPLITFGRKRMSSYSMLPLQRSIGVILAVFGNLPVCEMAISTWKSHVDEFYTKTDETDAIYIGKALINIALTERTNYAEKSYRANIKFGTPKVKRKTSGSRTRKARSPKSRK